jgi:hypothetical protein
LDIKLTGISVNRSLILIRIKREVKNMIGNDDGEITATFEELIDYLIMNEKESYADEECI